MLLPGAILDPGAHWNYQAGTTLCLMDVWHYTVGRNSIALIRDNGLCAFLVRDEGVYQMAPSDARCFTQCEWNGFATATEVESLDGWISQAQMGHLGYLTSWKLAQHGIPFGFYDGPRLPIGTDYRGVTNHRNLIHRACDMHSDGFDQWVWDAVMKPPAPKPAEEGMISVLVHEVPTGKVWVVNPDSHTRTWITSPEALGAQVDFRNVVKYFGGSADATIHRTDENDGLWARLLADCREVITTPRGFFVRATGGGPVWLITPDGYRINADAQGGVMAFVGWTANSPGSPYEWAQVDIDKFPLWNPAATGGGSGGATKSEVAAIVEADGIKTRAAVAAPKTVQLSGTSHP